MMLHGKDFGGNGIERLLIGRAFESSDSVGKSYQGGDLFEDSNCTIFVHFGTQVAQGKMYDVGDERLILKEPIDIIYKFLPDEVLALFPELELMGEGPNEFEALEDLKCELRELHEYMSTVNQKSLGRDALRWRKILHRIVEPCP